MDRHTQNDGRFKRLTSITGHSFHLVQDIPPIQESTKHSVEIVQMRLLLVENKELRLVGIGTSIGHTKLSSLIVRVVGVKLIGKLNFISPNGGFLASDMSGIATLNHEALDVSMEDRVVILSRGTKRKEIKASPWASVTEDLDFQVPHACMKSNRHD
jgi:hypothetical protein